MEKRTIGGFIAHLRKERGMTQKQLAEKLRVSDKTISRWEREESLPDLNLVPVLAEIFSVSVDELLQGARSAPTPNPQKDEARPGEKQLRHMMKATQTGYLLGCLRSVLISVLGALLVLACVEGLTWGHGVDRFSLALALDAGVQLIALAYQTNATVRTMTSLGEDFAGTSVRDLRRKLVKWGMMTYSAQIVAAIFSVMLAGSWTAVEWVALGAIWGGGGALLCGIVCRVVWSRMKKRGII